MAKLEATTAQVVAALLLLGLQGWGNYDDGIKLSREGEMSSRWLSDDSEVISIV